jgi:hypothetical protein
MIRSIAAVGFVLSVATFAQAMTPAPIPQTDRIISQNDAIDPIRTCGARNPDARTMLRWRSGGWNTSQTVRSGHPCAISDKR